MRRTDKYRGVMTEDLEVELEAEQAYYRALIAIAVRHDDMAIVACEKRIYSLQTEIERRRS